MELSASGVDTSTLVSYSLPFYINMDFIILFQGHTKIIFFLGPASGTSCFFKKLDDGLIPKKETCISESYIKV
jgi:hypothetical protein